MNNSEQIKLDLDDLFDKRKYYAQLIYWSGEEQIIEIRKKFIQDIVDAVEGQFTFINRETGLCVYGNRIQTVNIYVK